MLVLHRGDKKGTGLIYIREENGTARYFLLEQVLKYNVVHDRKLRQERARRKGRRDRRSALFILHNTYYILIILIILIGINRVECPAMVHEVKTLKTIIIVHFGELWLGERTGNYYVTALKRNINDQLCDEKFKLGTITTGS